MRDADSRAGKEQTWTECFEKAGELAVVFSLRRCLSSRSRLCVFHRKPDIEIPLIGSPPKTVAAMHHIRIWKDNGQWYVRDLDTTNYSAILKNNNWELLNDITTRKGKKMTLDENFTKLAIGYRSGGRTEIEFSFYKQ